ncbi:4'-phosphopantetheinyl transferase superfamily protein [Methylobacillus gramineus]|uniref:4'-phosphopantetheinyl transferase family protein n=1 Tax=Methylobacillus gramineus TaxID=755169 RepID=UPI001CFF9AD5|nr:4'-phosphopantetheinyl transferase superfamily protein [Methylobacillus gramineus]MCB5183740.1 4'-phosphopantetheinyl transferase superfamily protein [Methylobacillus gramineus]
MVIANQIDRSGSDRKQQRMQQSRQARELLAAALAEFQGLHYTPATMPLLKDAHGKPWLDFPHAPHISIAHSGNWVSCAIARSAHIANIGIDIEMIQHRNWEAYREYVFHPEESDWILAANGDERNARGLTCWCRKEAIAKAVGTGLSFPPSHIGFDQHQRLISLPDDMGQAQDWHIHDSNLHDEAILCIAWKALPMDNAV